jgi:hypothetical protein
VLVCDFLQARWITSVLPPKQLEYAIKLVLVGGAVGLSAAVLMVLGYVLRSPTFGWTGVCGCGGGAAGVGGWVGGHFWRGGVVCCSADSAGLHSGPKQRYGCCCSADGSWICTALVPLWV